MKILSNVAHDPFPQIFLKQQKDVWWSSYKKALQNTNTIHYLGNHKEIL